MPSFSLPQHLFSSVTQGLFPERGRGFQTVGCTPELRDTADLKELEEASFFAVGPERRSVGALPVKEMFYRLSSGRFAVGRIEDAGIDSLGREGNYRAHHVILTREQVAALGWQPFSVLDASPWGTAAENLTPRLLEPFELEPGTASAPELLADRALLGRVASALAEAGEKTVLVIGDEVRSRAVVRALFPVLPTREREALTFSTYFFEGNPYRHLFRVATVPSRGEAPAAADTEAYRVVDQERSGTPLEQPYALWLNEVLSAGRWEELRAVHDILDQMRTGQSVPEEAFPTPASGWTSALLQQEGAAFQRSLLGRPKLLAGVLAVLPEREALALALFKQHSPRELAGADEGAGAAAIAALKQAAKPKHWTGWLKRHKDEPLMKPFRSELDPAWKKLAARLPFGKK